MDLNKLRHDQEQDEANAVAFLRSTPETLLLTIWERIQVKRSDPCGFTGGRWGAMSEKVARYLALHAIVSRDLVQLDDMKDEADQILASMSPAERALVTWEGPGKWFWNHPTERQ